MGSPEEGFPTALQGAGCGKSSQPHYVANRDHIVAIPCPRPWIGKLQGFPGWGIETPQFENPGLWYFQMNNGCTHVCCLSTTWDNHCSDQKQCNLDESVLPVGIQTRKKTNYAVLTNKIEAILNIVLYFWIFLVLIMFAFRMITRWSNFVASKRRSVCRRCSFWSKGDLISWTVVLKSRRHSWKYKCESCFHRRPLIEIITVKQQKPILLALL